MQEFAGSHILSVNDFDRSHVERCLLYTSDAADD